MDGEADILQHRVEVAAFERRRIEAREGVGGKQREAAEGGDEHALHAQNKRQQVARQAAAEHGDGSVEAIGIEGWNNIIAVNQTGVMLTIQNAMRAMAKNPDGPTGSIIVNSSMNAHRAMGNFVAYSVSKAAVIALVKSSAVHAGNQKYKIRVNAVLPGVVETAMIKNLIDKSADPQATRAAYEGLSPMGRMATVEEIAGLVAWLSSDEARFSSGSEFVMDGASTAGMNGV